MEISFREFAPGDEAAFRRLNEEWITTLFALEDQDLAVLNDPTGHILQPGGAILFAEQDGVAVGCCALVAMGDGCFEVAKMAVSGEMRGLGIGRRLLEFVVEIAHRRGAKRLYLETNQKLQNAIHLYTAVGFVHVPKEQWHASPYARSDVKMEVILG